MRVCTNAQLAIEPVMSCYIFESPYSGQIVEKGRAIQSVVLLFTG